MRARRRASFWSAVAGGEWGWHRFWIMTKMRETELRLFSSQQRGFAEI